jgi:thiamine pyrophosphate-dependent acetolactate synthase large subunit-like protein
VSDPAIIPEAVRKAFAVAETEKPGATHLELPEDVMAAAVADDVRPLARREPVRPEPSARELLRAADLIRARRRVVALAGNGAVRGKAASVLTIICIYTPPAHRMRARARRRGPRGRDVRGTLVRPGGERRTHRRGHARRDRR